MIFPNHSVNSGILYSDGAGTKSQNQNPFVCRAPGNGQTEEDEPGWVSSTGR